LFHEVAFDGRWARPELPAHGKARSAWEALSANLLTNTVELEYGGWACV
jgi:hypothetical protein